MNTCARCPPLTSGTRTSAQPRCAGCPSTCGSRALACPPSPRAASRARRRRLAGWAAPFGGTPRARQILSAGPRPAAPRRTRPGRSGRRRPRARTRSSRPARPRSAEAPTPARPRRRSSRPSPPRSRGAPRRPRRRRTTPRGRAARRRTTTRRSPATRKRRRRRRGGIEPAPAGRRERAGPYAPWRWAARRFAPSSAARAGSRRAPARA
mmetsp:Transcript_29006/g.82451  ORF Transcript_29006/g.82451 Transcript_29006/m.82451 type:complete len:209 (+) Transcript_29006:367-993(+)